MPAHLKASMLGSSVSIPVTDGMLNLSTWQGIYFCGHRNDGGARELIMILIGQEMNLVKGWRPDNVSSVV
jgi:secondary thiamine-phosphate synthase enzyme